MRFSRAGVGVLGVTLAGDNHSVGQAIEMVAWARDLADIVIIISLSRLSMSCEIRAAGKMAIFLHSEGTRCFEQEPRLIDPITNWGSGNDLAFNNANSVGGGCAKCDGGLQTSDGALCESSGR